MKITFDDGYEVAYTLAYPHMKKLRLTGICYIVVDWIGQKDRLKMNQLKELVENGWEIASHTLTHPDLTKIPLNQAEIEIAHSKVELELMGFKINTFAYPYGRFNDEIIEIVKKHYDWARACYSTITGDSVKETQWTEKAYNLVNMLEGEGYPAVHSINQPQYRSNISMETFEKLCQTLV